MPEQTFDPNQPFTTEEAPAAPAQPQGGTPVASEFRTGSNPFRDEDFPEYTRLVMDRRTTPAQLTEWMEQRGYGRSTNAAEVLTFHRRNPRIRPVNSFNLTGTNPPAPDGMPQPGTPTDWLPDFIQAPVERAGLALGLIDPKTYYGLGDYGENARAPNRPTTISNTPVPTWTERMVRSAGESFSPAGGSAASIFKRASADVADDDAIRHYGSQHNWTGQQIDAAIASARADRARAIQNQREQWAIRDADEARREDGGKPTWLGWAKRGSADLVGAGVADGPLLLAAPEIRGAEAVAPVLGRVAGKISEAAAPVVERFVAKVAPSAAGQAAVQGATDVASQTSEVQAGIKDHYDPVQTVVRASLGAAIPVAGSAAKPLVGSLAKGAGNVAGKVADVAGNASDALSSRFNGMVSKTYTRLAADAENLARTYEANGDAAGAASARRSAEAYRTRAQEVSSVDPALPAGMTPRDVARATKQLAGIQLEANNFKGTPEPKPEDVFPTDASRAADAEAWGKSLGAPEPAPVEAPAAPAEPAPAAEPTISRKEADAQFKEATGKTETQTPAQWGKSLEQQAAEWKASREAGNTEPAPSPATRNAVAEAPPVEAAPVETPAAPDGAPQFEGDVVQRLTTAINDAGRLSREQAALLSQSRSDKLRGVVGARATSSGEAGLSSELAQLRGETPRVDYEGVRGQFTQDEIDGLFNSVRDNPNLSLFDSINARTGLAKLLDGTVPTRSEINLLSQVFPADFIKAAMRHRSTSSKIADFAGNALNLPRSMMSTLDLSAPLRQGVFLTGRREFYSAFASMFKQFGSERAFRGVMDDIRARETYPLMEESGLSLTNLGHDLSQREEAFMSQWAERIPVYGRAVRASERGFSGFLNKLRADTFDDLVRRSTAAGVDFQANPKALSDIASFVNAATGRGNLGALNSSAPLLNGLLFSPRLIASRVTLLNPAYYAQLSPVVRQEAVKSLLTFGTLATSVLTMFKMGGADVETDPRSSDFGKIKIGNTRYDIFGGFVQYITLGARLATNETVTLKGEEQTLGEGYGSRTRLDVAANFLANKASPVAGYVRDYLRGADPVGTPFNAGRDAVELFIPLFLQDAAKVYEEGGVEALPRIAPGFFGVGVGTYGDKPKFDHNQEFTQEVAPDAAPVPEPESPPTFDPKQPFDTTTSSNLQAADILSNMGFQITDDGVRSEEEQANYYNNTQGAAAPGTSPHESGNAIDIRVPQGVRPSDIVAELTAQGFRGVTIITRRHGTGPHWHIQWESAGE